VYARAPGAVAAPTAGMHFDEALLEKIRAMGSDAVKVLAWYRPDADAAVNEHQKRFVQEIGKDCARHDGYSQPYSR